MIHRRGITRARTTTIIHERRTWWGIAWYETSLPMLTSYWQFEGWKCQNAVVSDPIFQLYEMTAIVIGIARWLRVGGNIVSDTWRLMLSPNERIELCQIANHPNTVSAHESMSFYYHVKTTHTRHLSRIE